MKNSSFPYLERVSKGLRHQLWSAIAQGICLESGAGKIRLIFLDQGGIKP